MQKQDEDARCPTSVDPQALRTREYVLPVVFRSVKQTDKSEVGVARPLSS